MNNINIIFFQQISSCYDRDPNLYSADVDALYQLRKSAIDALTSSACSVDDCTSLKRYYVHLVRLTDKFPKLLEQQINEVQDSCDDDINIAGEPSLMFWWLVLTISNKQ